MVRIFSTITFNFGISIFKNFSIFFTLNPQFKHLLISRVFAELTLILIGIFRFLAKHVINSFLLKTSDDAKLNIPVASLSIKLKRNFVKLNVSIDDT